MSISENIRRFRKEARLTQKELAAKCGFAEITIRQYETEKREPRAEQLKKIADALGISPAELSVGYGEMEELLRRHKQRMQSVHSALDSKARKSGPKIRTDLLIMGELLVEIMRDRADVPLNCPGVFKGPYPSGAPAICADAAARLGCRTTLIGNVGKDDFGELLLNRLKSDGVDCTYITEDSQLATGCAFVTYFNDGSRKFIFHMEAASEALLPPLSRFGEIKYMHVMGCSLMAGEKLASEILKAVRFLSGQGTKISFDPNIRKELFRNPEVQESFRDMLDLTSIYLPGREELLLTTGAASVDEAVSVCFENPRLEMLVLKDGARGSVLYTRKDTSPDSDNTPAAERSAPYSPDIAAVRVNAYQIEQKDATGAGDCFDGAFLAGLIQGNSPEEAARMGAAAGALNAMEFGPMEGKISPEAVTALTENGGDS